MENKSHAIAAGSFVLLLFAMLVALAVWLTRDTTSQRVYEIVSKEAVNGLQPQSAVRYKGVQVGHVTAITLDPEVRGQVLLRIAVNDNAPVGNATLASLGFQGVTGLAFVQLDDSGDPGPPLATSSSRVGRIAMRQGTMSRLTDQAGRVVEQLNSASQRLNTLLAPENQQALVNAVNKLATAAEGIQQLSRHADQAITGTGGPGSASLPQFAAQADTTMKSLALTSERLRDSAEAVKNSAAEFRRASTRMTEPGGTLDKIARGAEALAASNTQLNTILLPRLGRTSEETTRTVRQFGRLAEGLTEQPQSLLFGKGAGAPGPGEPGFVAPTPDH